MIPPATVIATVNEAMIPAALRAVSESRNSRRAVSGTFPDIDRRFVVDNFRFGPMEIVHGVFYGPPRLRDQLQSLPCSATRHHPDGMRSRTRTGSQRNDASTICALAAVPPSSSVSLAESWLPCARASAVCPAPVSLKIK